MARDSSLIKVGFANIYVAPLGEALPTFDDDSYDRATGPGGNWELCGCTDAGSTLNFSRDVTDIYCHEEIVPADVVPTQANLALNLILKEDTLENMKKAYGGGTITTTAAGVGQIGKDVLALSDDLEKVAVLLDVETPADFYRFLHFPKVVSIGSVETSFQRAEARMYPVEWRYLGALGDIDIIEKTANAT